MSGRALLAAVDRAEAEVEELHAAGRCGESEWSCSVCEREAA